MKGSIARVVVACALLMLIGCDKDAKTCKDAKEGSFKDWTACNRACKNQDKASCERAIELAADVCFDNDEPATACDVACDDGNKKACTRQKKLDAEKDADEDDAPKKKAKTPKGDPPASDPTASWPVATIDGVKLKLPKSTGAKEAPNADGGGKLKTIGAESSDGHYCALTVIDLGTLSGEAVLENTKTSSFGSVKDKKVTTKNFQHRGMKGLEVRFTAPRPVQGAEFSILDATKNRLIKVTVVANDRWNESLMESVLASIEIP